MVNFKLPEGMQEISSTCKFEGQKKLITAYGEVGEGGRWLDITFILCFEVKIQKFITFCLEIIAQVSSLVLNVENY